MIVLVAGKRQAVALDGVGDEAHRAVVIDAVEGLDDGGQVVTAEIVHQRRDRVVAARLDQRRHRPLVADLVEKPLAPSRAALKHQRRIELVRAAIDPLPQRFAARLGEGLLLQRAVFEHHDVPAEIAEQVFVALPEALAHHGIEALPVVIDDPPAIAQALLPAFQHGLENIALVELGVAKQRDHAALRTRLAVNCSTPAVGAHVILRQRREQSLRHA